MTRSRKSTGVVTSLLICNSRSCRLRPKKRWKTITWGPTWEHCPVIAPTLVAYMVSRVVAVFHLPSIALAACCQQVNWVAAVLTTDKYDGFCNWQARPAALADKNFKLPSKASEHGLLDKPLTRDEIRARAIAIRESCVLNCAWVCVCVCVCYYNWLYALMCVCVYMYVCVWVAERERQRDRERERGRENTQTKKQRDIKMLL